MFGRQKTRPAFVTRGSRAVLGGIKLHGPKDPQASPSSQQRKSAEERESIHEAFIHRFWQNTALRSVLKRLS